MTAACPLNPMLRKLQLWKQFDAAEEAALLALPHILATLEPSKYVVREGARATHSCLLISGFAYRQKLTKQGLRSILAVQMSGDLVDLQNSLLVVADHSVQALTRAEVAYIPREAILDIAFRFPNIGMAMWYDTLVDASIFREWVHNIARRSGPTRIAHLICEFGLRLEAVGLGSRVNYQLPMTQEQLGDAVGLTPVHVNRCLTELQESGLLTRSVREISVGNWTALARFADFKSGYLHLPKGDRE